MSLQPQEVPPVPDETRRIARAAFPKGNVYIRMRDALGVQITPIAAHNRNSWMLGQPGCDGSSRAVRQQIHDPMRRQIHHNGAIAMTQPPGPLPGRDGLEG
jgi:hypothetical protein